MFYNYFLAKKRVGEILQYFYKKSSFPRPLFTILFFKKSSAGIPDELFYLFLFFKLPGFGLVG
jgi:hypothetical protein